MSKEFDGKPKEFWIYKAHLSDLFLPSKHVASSKEPPHGLEDFIHVREVQHSQSQSAGLSDEEREGVERIRARLAANDAHLNLEAKFLLKLHDRLKGES